MNAKSNRATLKRIVVGFVSGLLLFYLVCGLIFFIATLDDLMDPRYDTAAHLRELPIITFRFIVYAVPVWILLPVCLAVAVGIALFNGSRAR